jgi:hypothetical protein
MWLVDQNAILRHVRAKRVQARLFPSIAAIVNGNCAPRSFVFDPFERYSP